MGPRLCESGVYPDANGYRYYTHANGYRYHAYANEHANGYRYYTHGHLNPD